MKVALLKSLSSILPVTHYSHSISLLSDLYLGQIQEKEKTDPTKKVAYSACLDVVISITVIAPSKSG